MNEIVSIDSLNITELQSLERHVDRVAEAWTRLEQQLIDVAKKSGGVVVSEVDLPAPIHDRFQKGHKWYPCQYSRVNLSISSKKDGFKTAEKINFATKIGIAGKNGTFFAKPNESHAERQISEIQNDWRMLILRFGTAYKFLEAVLSESARIAVIPEEHLI